MGAAESFRGTDATFDLVYANNVLEHLAHPLAVFKEVHRV
jgi:ubiquinone/menaquinone biosynthesis C-methylase UbiE